MAVSTSLVVVSRACGALLKVFGLKYSRLRVVPHNSYMAVATNWGALFVGVHTMRAPLFRCLLGPLMFGNLFSGRLTLGSYYITTVVPKKYILVSPGVAEQPRLGVSCLVLVVLG